MLLRCACAMTPAGPGDPLLPPARFLPVVNTVQIVRKPLSLVVMGVSGAGKSTVGRHLAEKVGGKFLEGDDFHSEAIKAKMRSGIPLTDEDRYSWLLSLHSLLSVHIREQRRREREGEGEAERMVLSCSALTPSYRYLLRFGGKMEREERESRKNAGSILGDGGREEEEEEGRLVFIHLSGSYELFYARLLERYKEGVHYMPPSLLKSQMDTLQIGKIGVEPIITVDASRKVEEIASDIITILGM